ncbi:hypothetical protein BGZ96_011008 [Linnemannia gamsii]|uniref:F-box domain-containing protein n=1 Tax=Linnemannia gamsii TaxID=64522 RepID=A0ABQ7KE50_9FUNG|nr:hypothetical protein BGZ96_011008 [Linnemannia gamsii]
MELSTLSPCERMLEIPELAELLGKRLSKPGIVALMTTNKNLRAKISAFLYRFCDFAHSNSIDHKIFTSQDALRAMARNIHHIKKVTAVRLFVPFYYNSLLAHQGHLGQLKGQDASQEKDTGYSGRPLPAWTPSPEPCVARLVPLPPMINLTSIELSLNKDSREHKNPSFASYNKHPIVAKQLAWILQQCPLLRSIDITLMTVRTADGLRLLANTFASLTHLTKLLVEFETPKEYWTQFALDLYYSAPRSLKGLAIDFHEVYPAAEHDPHDSTRPIDFSLEQLRRRQGPFDSLESLTLPILDDATLDDIATIYSHCPWITELSTPRFYDETLDHEEVGEVVAFACQHITQLHHLHSEIDPNGVMEETILVNLPAGTFKDLYFLNYIGELPLAMAIANHHSSSITKIYFEQTEYLSSEAIQQLLCRCSSLEEFRVESAFSDSRAYIELEDAVVTKWASTKLRVLDLEIQILPPDQRTTPFYERPPPVVLTKFEKDQFELLEKLYGQIGSLKGLEQLTLKVYSAGPTSDMYRMFSFPAMLNLGDVDAGIPGYLQLFAGLTKLKKLAGSVSATTLETLETIGRKECDWMLKHWVSLEKAEFLSKKGNRFQPTKRCFTNMVQRKPSLDLTYDSYLM